MVVKRAAIIGAPIIANPAGAMCINAFSAIFLPLITSAIWALIEAKYAVEKAMDGI
jgi:hypothetical protein